MTITDKKYDDEINCEVKCLTDNTSKTPDIAVKVYTRRWFNLILFLLFTASHSIQWGQFIVVANITSRYFNVTQNAIAWTAFVTNVLYVILLYPLSYLVFKIDVRYTCIIASITAFISSWMKLLTLSPDNFLIMFIAQILIGCWQVTIMSIPALFVAYWFGSDQISQATALSASGMSISIAIISTLATQYVRNHENIDDITKDLYSFFLGIAIFCTITTLAMLLFFQNEPKIPPSKSRALQKLFKQDNFVFWPAMKRILRDRNFILLSNAMGIHLAVNTNILTLMNVICVPHLENGEQVVGLLILIIIIVGLIGCVFFGKIQDKIKQFKQLSVFLYCCTLVVEILFALALYMSSKWAVFTTTGLLGFFMVPFCTTGVETVVEAVYPESEATSIAIVGIANQIYGVILLLISNELMAIMGDMAIHIVCVAALIIGLILMLLTSDVRRRQNATKTMELNKAVLISH